MKTDELWGRGELTLFLYSPDYAFSWHSGAFSLLLRAPEEPRQSAYCCAYPRLREIYRSDKYGVQIARTCLIDVLQNDGVRIAFPIGDGEMDMLASIDSRATPGRWIPVRVIAADSDALPGRFEHVGAPGLLVAMVSDSASAGTSPAYRTFALTLAELIVVRMAALIAQKGAAKAACTADSGHTSRQILQSALESSVIRPGQWRKQFIKLLKDQTFSRA